MKLIKLEILNLASLDNPNGETINFEEGALKDCTIFSIVGPTGSGKSTILDAICLALYNRTPRYPRQRNDRSGRIEIYGESDSDRNKRLATTDCRNILTRGKKEGYSKLTFTANDGYIYRAEWHIKFKITKYDDTITKLYRLKTQTNTYIEEEISWDTITQIIGLDYEQFLRTVLLAQGSFANFLTAKENERYELLEKLVGCEELYSTISREIKNRKDIAKENYNKISASVENIKQNILSDEDLTKLNAEIEQLETTQRTLEKKIKQIETELKWYSDEKIKIENISLCQINDEKATNALKEIENDINLLTLHDTILPALNQLRDIKTIETENESNSKEINDKKLQKEKLKNNINKKIEEFKILKNNEQEAIDKQQKFNPIIAEARTLKGKISTSENVLNETKRKQEKAKNEKNTAYNNLSKNQSDIKQNQEATAIANANYTTIETKIKQKLSELTQAQNTAENNLTTERTKNNGIDVNNLQQAKTIAEQELKYINNAKELIDQYETNIKEKNEKEKEKKLLENNNIELTKLLNKLTIEELEKQYNTTHDAYTLITSTNWVQQRAKLKSNEPCPLCGSTNHPYCNDITKVESISHKLKEQCDLINQKLIEQKENQTKWQSQKNSNEGKISILKIQLNELDDKLTETISKWTKLLSSFSKIQNYSILDKTAIITLIPHFENKQKTTESALTTYLNIQNEINRLQTIKENIDKTLAEYQKQSEKQLQKIQTEINKLKEDEIQLKAATPILEQQLNEKTENLQNISNELNTQQEKLNSLKQQLKDKLQYKDPDSFERELKSKAEQASSLVKEKENEIQKITESLKTIEGELSTLQNKLTHGQNKLNENYTLLNNWIINYNTQNSPISIEDIFAIYNSTYHWEGIRKIKDDLQNKKTATATLLANAQTEYKEHLKTKPQKSQNELLQEHNSIKQQNNNDLLVTAKAKRKNHDDAIKFLGSKAEELNLATEADKNWSAINDAIGGEGKTLRKIAQCYTLSFLVEYANTEIRRFNNRYELVHVKNSLGIRVIDHDRADDIRDTTSLSGGETFIVSLGLALGLSTLSSRNISFDNLFIDEGFGTLDPDALVTVIDSLAMLQSSQGKKVCVISHTDTMSERITTQIRVIKNGNSGSSHIEIYS